MYTVANLAEKQRKATPKTVLYLAKKFFERYSKVVAALSESLFSSRVCQTCAFKHEIR